MRETILQLAYYRWLVLAVACTGTFMSTLTTSIVNVALPPIATLLNTDLPTAQWIVSAYLLLITGLLPVMGRLGDLWGRRRMYSIGFLGFSLGCLLCSISWSIEFLIFSRLVQAVGASAIMANSMAVVTAAFPVNERGKVLGIIATTVALGQISGPSLGGFLVSSFNWQAIFYVSVIIGILGFIGARLILPENQKISGVSIDYHGAALFFLGMMCFLLALNNGAKWGYGVVLLLLFIAGMAFAAFFRQERRVEFPIVDLNIFKIKAIFWGNILGLIQFIVIAANTILLPFFLHDVKQLPLTDIGFLMLVFPFLSAIVTPFSGTLSDRTTPGLLVSLGLFFTAIGLYFTANLKIDSTIFQIVAGQAVLGLGNALFQPANNIIVMGEVPADKLGIASGLNALARNMGLVVGTAAAVAIFDYRRLYYARQGWEDASATLETIFFVNAYYDTILLAALVAAGGFFLSLKQRKKGRVYTP